MWTILGWLIFAVSIYFLVRSMKTAKSIDRERFERTNSAGVQEFPDYDAASRASRREARNRTALIMSILLILGSAFFAIVIGPEFDRWDESADHEVLWQACMDGDFRQCRALCREDPDGLLGGQACSRAVGF